MKNKDKKGKTHSEDCLMHDKGRRQKGTYRALPFEKREGERYS